MFCLHPQTQPVHLQLTRSMNILNAHGVPPFKNLLHLPNRIRPSTIAAEEDILHDRGAMASDSQAMGRVGE